MSTQATSTSVSLRARVGWLQKVSVSCSMRWRGKNCSKIGQDSVRHSLSELGSCVILKGMRSLLSTYQMIVLFLVCQMRSSSSTYLSGIDRKGRAPSASLVVDRFHVVKNLSEVLQEILGHCRAEIQKARSSSL